MIREESGKREKEKHKRDTGESWRGGNDERTGLSFTLPAGSFFFCHPARSGRGFRAFTPIV